MASYYYPESVQGGRWLHQEDYCCSHIFPSLKPWCPKTNILPKKHHQNKTLDRKMKSDLEAYLELRPSPSDAESQKDSNCSRQSSVVAKNYLQCWVVFYTVVYFPTIFMVTNRILSYTH